MSRSLGLRSLTTGAVCLEMSDCRREGATLGAEALREEVMGKLELLMIWEVGRREWKVELKVETPSQEVRGCDTRGVRRRTGVTPLP